jgi:hypothetical protein
MTTSIQRKSQFGIHLVGEEWMNIILRFTDESLGFGAAAPLLLL